MSKTEKPKTWRDVIKVHPAAELFPLMTPDELKALGEDIKANGLRAPIVLFTDGADDHPLFQLLDGRNRLDAMELVGMPMCREDGEDFVPAIRKTIQFTDGDPYAYVLSANVHRRHLTPVQKREIIAKVLKAQPEKSNREIARQVKDDHHKVGAVRRELEATGEVSPVEKTTGKDGKARKHRTFVQQSADRERARQNAERKRRTIDDFIAEKAERQRLPSPTPAEQKQTDIERVLPPADKLVDEIVARDQCAPGYGMAVFCGLVEKLPERQLRKVHRKAVEEMLSMPDCLSRTPAPGVAYMEIAERVVNGELDPNQAREARRAVDSVVQATKARTP